MKDEVKKVKSKKRDWKDTFMKKRLIDVLGKYNITNLSGFIKKNLLKVLLTLFVCLAISLSAYFGSDVTDGQDSWNASITHVPSTPTPTLVPDAGWWSTVASPTPK
jgi:hypothetical protein